MLKLLPPHEKQTPMTPQTNSPYKSLKSPLYQGLFYNISLLVKNRVKLTKVNSFICNSLIINHLKNQFINHQLNEKQPFFAISVNLLNNLRQQYTTNSPLYNHTIIDFTYKVGYLLCGFIYNLALLSLSEKYFLKRQ